ncbi:hypothetical protein JNUCC64_19160 [Streptomyces sp. JNUCC 64]
MSNNPGLLDSLDLLEQVAYVEHVAGTRNEGDGGAFFGLLQR